jgi:hypothetical protein
MLPLHRLAEHQVEFAGRAQHLFPVGMIDECRVTGQARCR